MNIHPELKRVLTRIGMRDELCCPFCVHPSRLVDITVVQSFYCSYVKECPHWCDVYSTDPISPNGRQMSIFNFSILGISVICDFFNQTINVRIPANENNEAVNIVNGPLNLNIFDNEQTCIKKIHLYLTLS